MSERESWMPSDEEICAAWAADARLAFQEGTFQPVIRFTPGVNSHALIRTAVERALAEQEARHRREVIEARVHELNLNGCRAETPTLRRLEDLRAELAALEEKP